MTPAEMKTYEKNIKGKALSLVASENVRSIYNYGVELKQANNKNGATFKDRTIPVDSIGEPVTIVPEKPETSTIHIWSWQTIKPKLTL